MKTCAHSGCERPRHFLKPVCASHFMKEYYRANKEKWTGRWKLKDPAKEAVRKQLWRETNREINNACSRRYRENNKPYYAAYSAARRAKDKQATPAWADLEKIREIYRNCPEGHHVDHVIPINGKNVCGLHVEHNLQYLPAVENLRKSNKLLVAA